MCLSDLVSTSPTAPQTSTFQDELDSYVRALNLPVGDARRTLRLIAKHDFSAARAHIVASGERAVWVDGRGEWNSQPGHRATHTH